MAKLKQAIDVMKLKRGELDKALLQVTDKQRAFLKQVFPNGIPDNKVDDAYGLAIRTINSNKA